MEPYIFSRDACVCNHKHRNGFQNPITSLWLLVNRSPCAWSLDFGYHVKESVYSINRYLHLTDSTQAPGRDLPNYDPLHKVRPLVDQLNIKFPEFFKPGKNLSIDESMVGFKGRLQFKQYWPRNQQNVDSKFGPFVTPQMGTFSKCDVYTDKA